MADSVHGIHVELHVPDFEPARKFYEAFGFVESWVNEASDASAYMVMTHGNSVLCFWPGNDTVDQPYFGQLDQTTTRGYGVEIVVQVDDLDEAYVTAKSFDAVVTEMKMKPWGLRDFRCVDPFGYYIRFTERHDVTADDYGGRLRVVD